MSVKELEPIRPKKEFPDYFPLSVRTFERCLAEGIPHYRVMGKVGFRCSEVEEWLVENGHMEKRGGDE